jgi:exodeoxyribonuclease V beta subunit
MKKLDTVSFPLIGPSLIEASAGTGKTYTIVNLYLRLLLGHRCAPLGLEQILVVTFTKAATAELKTRIREKLRQSFQVFLTGESQDPFMQSLLSELPDHSLACRRLALATKQMDEAAIFTIHGFSQRMLTQHAFESGAMYENTFILDESDWLKVALNDYWRRSIVVLPPEVLAFVLKVWPNPESLLKNLQSLLYRRVLPKASISTSEALAKVDEYAHDLSLVKQWWINEQVSQQLLDANLRANSNLAKPTFLQSVQDFCMSQDQLASFDKDLWENLTVEKIAKANKKDSVDLSHLDFSRIDTLQTAFKQCIETITLAFSHDALLRVGENLTKNKQLQQLLSPDDLLTSLEQALTFEKNQDKSKSSCNRPLAKAIQQAYPAVLIDEFQDTDPLQFEVFNCIYAEKLAEIPPCWIMIGDPKQAIYAFRGADIFTYIQAKDLVPQEQQFTLSHNWRSKASLVEAINGLFSSSEQGFLFQQSIPFYPVEAARELTGLQLHGKSLAALEFHHLKAEDAKPVPWSIAQGAMAAHVAGQISTLLIQAQNGELTIEGRALTAGDCCVLVRDRLEAELIKQALLTQGIASVFLARKSVFATQLALDLSMLLKALAHPQDERLLKSAIITELFAFSAAELDSLFDDETRWQSLIEQVQRWHRQWQEHGIMLVLNAVAHYFELEQGLLAQYVDGMRRLTDFRHLLELLQQQSEQLQGEAQVLHWLQERITQPDHNHEGQQLRLENDANLLQIITQHASKGLEFPVVFVPFASRHKAIKQALYHDADRQLLVDFLKSPENMETAQREQLAEDLRLLYVALTRAVHHCSIGIWNGSDSQRKNESNLLKTAIGCLLFRQENQCSDELIRQTIGTLASSLDISYRTVDKDKSFSPLVVNKIENTASALRCQTLQRSIKRDWRLTSYSAISAQQAHVEHISPGMDEGSDRVFANALPEEYDPSISSPFSFERGANAGSFLHGVLEHIDFQKSEQLGDAISQQGAWFGIDDYYYPMLEQWLKQVLNTPLDRVSEEGLSLSAISPEHRKVEMEFFMPLRKVQLEAFNRLINRFSANSYRETHRDIPQRSSRDYQFEQLNGMIKGFIDLMFEYGGKYYVADYKSNHLGYIHEDYHLAAMEEAMSEHDYHLQAILYTLALHRWLKHKLANYSYEQHIGGAYYLFIRGMSDEAPDMGIYRYKAQKELIESLDLLFDGKDVPITDSVPKTKEPSDSSNKATRDKIADSENDSGQMRLW